MVVQSTSNLTRTDMGFFCLFMALFFFFFFLSYEGAHTLMPINPVELWVNIAVYTHISRLTHEKTHTGAAAAAAA